MISTRTVILVTACVLLFTPVYGTAQSAGEDATYTFLIRFYQGDVSIADISAGGAPVPPSQRKGPYLLELVDADGETVHVEEFDMDVEVHKHFNATGADTVTEAYERVITPYYPDAERAVLYHNDRQEDQATIQVHTAVQNTRERSTLEEIDDSHLLIGGLITILLLFGIFLRLVLPER